METVSGAVVLFLWFVLGLWLLKHIAHVDYSVRGFAQYFDGILEEKELLHVEELVEADEGLIEEKEVPKSAERFLAMKLFEDNLHRRECKIDVPRTAGIVPKYHTDPDKFLIPVLAWGPNNQMRGFREALILARKMNRTICLPPFFKHHSDKSTQGGNVFIPPELRVDLSTLRSLTTVCETSEIQEKCAGHVDAVLYARAACSSHLADRLEIFREFTGLYPFLDADCGPRDGIPTFPARDSFDGKMTSNLAVEGDKHIHQLYPVQDSRCVVWVFPYVQFKDFTKYIHADWNRSVDKSLKLKDPEDLLFLKRLVQDTGRPPFIKKMIDRFMEQIVQGKNYIAVHYRFDTDDWMKHCELKVRKLEKSLFEINFRKTTPPA